MLLQQQVSPEQRLYKAVVDIIHHDRYTALAGVLMIGDRTIENDLPTACTNGRDEMYGRAWVEMLSDPELRFMVLHESRHKLYRHLTTWAWMYDIDPVLANKACDYVINLEIVEENPDGFATMPQKDELDEHGNPTGKCVPMGLLDTKYRGWDSAKVFHDLLDNQGESDGPGEGEGEGEGEGGSGSGQGEPTNGSGGSNQSAGLDDHDWEGAKELTDEDKLELEREIDEAVRQGALMAGKAGHGKGALDLNELLQPQIDWKQVLREFVTRHCAGNDFSTWNRPNRRFIGAGIYMPSGVSERIEDIVLANDASGSCWDVMDVFRGECQGVLSAVKPDKVHVMYWDTEVAHPHEVYTGESEMESYANATMPKGGGGTIVECVPAYLQEHNLKPAAVIILTDGYLGGGWGQWNCPVLWCIVDNKSAKPDCGTVVHISRHELR